MPRGATVVLKDAKGKRIDSGFEFHYTGWKGNEFDNSNNVRKGATKEDPFPAERRKTGQRHVEKTWNDN